jgi:hypothetical protein
MTAETEKDSKKRPFRLSDLIGIICFLGLAALLIYAAVSLWETWKISTLSRQFFGR